MTPDRTGHLPKGRKTISSLIPQTRRDSFISHLDQTTIDLSAEATHSTTLPSFLLSFFLFLALTLRSGSVAGAASSVLLSRFFFRFGSLAGLSCFCTQRELLKTCLGAALFCPSLAAHHARQLGVQASMLSAQYKKARTPHSVDMCVPHNLKS